MAAGRTWCAAARSAALLLRTVLLAPSVKVRDDTDVLVDAVVAASLTALLGKALQDDS